MKHYMKAPSEHADDAFEDEWLERMSPRERRMYRARRASVRVNGSDLTVSEWREFGRLRALHGEDTAHAFHDAIRRKRLDEERRARGPDHGTSERIGAAAFTLFGRTLSGAFFVLPATACLGWLGFVASASIVACVAIVASVAAYGACKAM